MLAWCCLCVPRAAAAEWLLTPFIGLKIDGQTNLAGVDQAAAETKLTYGGSGALLGDGLFGLEADFGYSPGFFDSSERGGLVTSSNVITLTGNLLIAMPRALTHDSLRPYVAAGAGLLHVGIGDQLDVLRVESNVLGLDVGVGAIGRLTERTSVRFDLRRFQSLTEDAAALAFGRSRLSFWRAGVGLTFRY